MPPRLRVVRGLPPVRVRCSAAFLPACNWTPALRPHDNQAERFRRRETAERVPRPLSLRHAARATVGGLVRYAAGRCAGWRRLRRTDATRRPTQQRERDSRHEDDRRFSARERRLVRRIHLRLAAAVTP